MARRNAIPEGLAARVARRLALEVRRGKSVCVAYSGGLDSTVLLDLLAASRAQAGIELSAMHVDHGLSPNSESWSRHCAEFAAARGVPLAIVRVSVDRGGGSGLEAAARAARRAALARCGADFVALAHHRDDQAETVLLQALRGTGLKGLSAMGAASRSAGITWLRPLLDEPREVLLAHARRAGLRWIEDESNGLAAFDRNFLRHEALPLLESRFPQCRASLARLAGHAAAASALLEELAREDAARLERGGGLDVAGLAALAPARRANVLRHFLAARGLAMPAQARLREMSRQLVGARGDACVLLLHGGLALRRHRGCVLVEAVPAEAARWDVAWNGERVLGLGAGRGEIHFSEVEGDGLALERLAAGRWHFAPRSGGERIRLRPGGRARTLKNLLQETAVPAWRRDHLPLLFDGERLAWVPGIGVAADYRAGGRSGGLVPRWEPSNPPSARSGDS